MNVKENDDTELTTTDLLTIYFFQAVIGAAILYAIIKEIN